MNPMKLGGVLVFLAATVGAQFFAPAVTQVLQAPVGRPLIVDIDGDGDADQLYFADGSPTWANGVIVVVNGGIGAANISYFLPVPASPSHTLDAGDIDGDGDREIVTCNGATFSVFLTSSSTVTRVDTNLVGARAVVQLVDVDADSDLDMLFDAHEIWWNDGTGAFTQGPILGLFANPVPGLITRAVDFDGDADLDLVCVWPVAVPPSFLYPSGSNNLWLGTFRQDGVGAFTTISMGLAHGDRIPSGLDLADLDGDGDSDVLLGLAGGISAPTTTAWLAVSFDCLDVTGGALTSLIAPGSPSTIIHGSGALAAGDVDGDGVAEILAIGTYPIAPSPPPIASLMRLVGGAVVHAQYFAIPHATHFARIVRYDADAMADVVAIGSLFVGQSSRLMVRRNEVIAQPITMTIVSGDNQVVSSGPPTFPQPFVIHLADGNGAPLVGRDVLAPLVAATGGNPFLSTNAVYTTTDANGNAALAPTISNFYGGGFLLKTYALDQSVTFSAYIRRFTATYSQVTGVLYQSILTDLANEPFIVGYDAPGIAISTPYGVVKTGVLSPHATTVLRDGIGLYGPADPSMVFGQGGAWMRTDIIPVALRGSGIPIVIQAYAAPSWAPYYVSNSTTITL